MCKLFKNNAGITLIALIITIIVLLILAGISIGALTGEGGIIGNTKNAKEETEIANEKEIIDKAVIMAMGENSRGNLVKEEFQDKLDVETGKGKTEVIDAGEEFGVTFIESNRSYLVDKDGNISLFEPIKDETPWELAGNGTKEDPYLIESIEDLIAFANEVNNGESYYMRYIKLVNTLDFNSAFSYDNPKTKVSEKANRIIKKDDNGVEIKKFLMDENGKGFNPIGGQTDDDSQFKGYFDGNNKEIMNIYINRAEENCVGLFGDKTSGYIRKLGISGKIIGGNNVGAINGGSSGYGNYYEINDCYNNAIVIGKNTVGGIIGESTFAKINRCYNKGNIFGENQVGGIAGYVWDDVFASINYGKIEGKNTVGGIFGGTPVTNYIISECYNIGEVKGETRVGGIGGNAYMDETAKILNCYNRASIYGKDSIGGILGTNASNIVKCYNIGEINGNDDVGGISGMLFKFIENCINVGEIKELGKISKGGIVGNDQSPHNGGKMINNFYQQGIATGGVEGKDIEGQAMPLPETQIPKVIDVIQNQIEVDGQMINVWKEDTNNTNNGYPILYWQ